MPSVGKGGFYRVAWSSPQVSAIARLAASRLSAEELASVIAELTTRSDSAEMQIQLLPLALEAADSRLRGLGARCLLRLLDVVPIDLRGSLARWLRRRVEFRVKKVRLDRSMNTPDLATIELLADFGNKQVVQQALRLLHHRDELPRDTRVAVLRIAVRTNQRVAGELLGEALTTKDRSERLEIIDALHAIPNVLDFAVRNSNALGDLDNTSKVRLVLGRCNAGTREQLTDHLRSVLGNSLDMVLKSFDACVAKRDALANSFDSWLAKPGK
jgi:hypothetical protein